MLNKCVVTNKTKIIMGKINGKHTSEKELPELIYVYDALCGWCYGFSPVISQLNHDFQSEIDFLVLSGGMVRGESVGPIRQIAPYLKNAYRVVEDTCGVKFGEKFLNDVLDKGDAIFTSVPPAHALAVFRIEKPKDTVDFAARLQKAIYYEGMLVENYAAYGLLAREFGLDGDNFVLRMHSDEIATIVEDEFKMVAGMGVNGYPALVLRKGKEMQVLARGYKNYETIAAMLKEAIH